MAFFKEEDYTLLALPSEVWIKNHIAIADWLMTLPDENYERSKKHLGMPNAPWGIYFRHTEDLVTFKLKFGL
jgi:hypothetical protein